MPLFAVRGYMFEYLTDVRNADGALSANSERPILTPTRRGKAGGRMVIEIDGTALSEIERKCPKDFA